MTTTSTPLDHTASACNRCAHVANATTAPCPVCKSTAGQTLITVASSFGVSA